MFAESNDRMSSDDIECSRAVFVSAMVAEWPTFVNDGQLAGYGPTGGLRANCADRHFSECEIS